MFRHLFAVVLVLAVCSGSPISPHILGGSDADIGDFPYIVNILNRGNNNWCGGVIVSATWVLTDAWCATIPIFVESFSVYSGSSILKNGTLHSVLQWVNHPQNDVNNKIYDFALFEVDPPFEFGENVAAVTLPSQEQGTPDNGTALIAGWGRTETSLGPITDYLQFAETVSFSEARCSAHLGPESHTSKLCAQDPNAQVGHCYYDEGGPLLIDGTLYGILQYPQYCVNVFEVQVYSRVASVRTWIDETIAM